eukprot:2833951-Rhodomonas_salina.1
MSWPEGPLLFGSRMHPIPISHVHSPFTRLLIPDQNAVPNCHDVCRFLSPALVSKQGVHTHRQKNQLLTTPKAVRLGRNRLHCSIGSLRNLSVVFQV